ncbi:hypothetical protein R2601_10699 [Salipiger bermudensis HTCC2601]|uniref:Uncharacterized protein n=1 Tax=Salipiger bermudensis (strain DSM 26914 / JCM 13377 / KCTC 12554 / HTCC2601) TaxID=314265 RepID=Q0FNH7_SALBH|nr:hypothetical protein R2601_10699 [Salipiger bermudensis HTCC2601]
MSDGNEINGRPQSPRWRSPISGVSSAMVPDQTLRPRSRITARSQAQRSSFSDLSITSSAMPVSALSAATACQISCRTVGASPSVASSRINRRGLVIRARPIASICCSPPEREAARWPRRSARRGNSASTRAASQWPGRAAAIRFSVTLRSRKQRRPSGTSPMPSRAARWLGRRDRSCPSKTSVPWAGSIRQMQCTVVVLPMPLRPIIATASPSAISRSTPNSAWLSP